MVRRSVLTAVAALALGVAGGVTLAQAATPPAIAAALADKGRPPADTARDPQRHPGELLAWAGVQPGQKVADLVMGGGYFTRILAAAVGPSGRVYGYQPAEFIRFQAQYGADQEAVAATYPNVTPISSPFAALKFPDSLDVVLTVQNYHDLHLQLFPADTAAKINAEVFRALKPGGTYVVVDHVGPAGYGVPGPMAGLHRIDPAIVKQEVEAAGFRFVGETDLLKAPADPHTKNVFDPAIRGRTDQFAYKFVKPKA